MAPNQSEISRDKTNDESGDMTRRTEDPVPHGTITEETTKNGEHDTTKKGHGTHGTTGTRNGTHGTATGPTGFSATMAGGHGYPIDHRPESLSSSEINGKVKIQESLPVVNSDQSGSNTPPSDTCSALEKKGVKEKIKERLPGGNNDHSGTSTPTINTSAHEKKGVEEMIKEKLPGSDSSDHSATSHTPPNDTNSHENKGIYDGQDQRVREVSRPPATRSIKLIE